MKIEVKEIGNISHAEKILSSIGENAYKASYFALKRAATSAEAIASKKATSEYMLSSGEFKSNVDFSINETHTENVSGMTVSFAGYVLNYPSLDLSYVGNGRGRRVAIRAKRSSTRAVLDRAFVADIWGHLGVYERIGDTRYKFRESYGPSTAHMMDNPIVKEKMASAMTEVYDKRMEHEVLRLMNGWGK